MSSLLIRGGTILTMNDRLDVVEGDVSVRDGRIVAVGAVRAAARTTRSIDARGALVLPGFIQTHIHLCQTLFRGYADDLALLDWLRDAHLADGSRAHAGLAARVGAPGRVANCCSTGTTTVLTMETVHDTDAVFEALGRAGPARRHRQVHDGRRRRGAGAAAGTDHAASIDESLALAQALARRAPTAGCARRSRRASPCRARATCSKRSARSRAQHGTLVHTHASEQRARDRPGRASARAGATSHYLADTGLTSPRLCVAHCVWVDEREQDVMAEHDVKVLHCPGSNLKLGSGLAPVSEMRARGISVSLGADGAACNNRLDMFEEMRLAAVLQAVRQRARRAPGPRRRLDGHARGRPRAWPRARDRLASSPASGPTSSWWTATARTSRPAPTRTPPWSTPPAAPTCGPPSWTARCSSGLPTGSASTAAAIAAEARAQARSLGAPARACSGSGLEATIAARLGPCYNDWWAQCRAPTTHVQPTLAALTERTRRILATLVRAHIDTGEPVASQVARPPRRLRPVVGDDPQRAGAARRAGLRAAAAHLGGPRAHRHRLPLLRRPCCCRTRASEHVATRSRRDCSSRLPRHARRRLGARRRAARAVAGVAHGGVRARAGSEHARVPPHRVRAARRQPRAGRRRGAAASQVTHKIVDLDEELATADLEQAANYLNSEFCGPAARRRARRRRRTAAARNACSTTSCSARALRLAQLDFAQIGERPLAVRRGRLVAARRSRRSPQRHHARRRCARCCG